MKSSLVALVIVLVAFAIASAGGDPRPALDRFDWLEGDWVRQATRGEVIESWKRVSQHTMEGVASITSQGETRITEHLRIESLGDDVFYIAKPRENPFPTPFKLIESDGMRFVFENPDHDFPQRILYTGDGGDGLAVRIEGLAEGGERGVDFEFERKK